MPTPCYLSLSSDGGILTSMEDILPSILRTFIGQPGNTSDFVEEYKRSFRMLDAKYGTSPEDMCNGVSTALRSIYERYFPNDNIDVICTFEILTEARYNLNISVVTTGYNGQFINLISKRKISVNHETHEFKINFGNNANQDIQLALEEAKGVIGNG